MLTFPVVLSPLSPSSLLLVKPRHLHVRYSLIAIIHAQHHLLDEVFAASSFESHSLIGTIGVVVSITSGIARPFVAKVNPNPSITFITLNRSLA
jgi:hypothetical protein